MESFSLDNLPYYRRVPKGREANLRYRREVLQACAESEEVRREWWIACSRDPLLYINTFLWIHEPRSHKNEPWITYDYQDDLIIDLVNAIGARDKYVDKARDMGATWCATVAFEWYWHFRGDASFLFLSWKADLVDKKGSKATIFFKFDFLHSPKFVPAWLIPNIHDKYLHRRNLDNDSVADGEGTSEGSGVANRCTAVWFDEFARFDGPQGKAGIAVWEANADVTRCRVATTTAKGVNNCAYHVLKSGVDHINLPWYVHPEKRAGLYRVKDGKVEIIDQRPEFPGALKPLYELLGDSSIKDWPNNYNFITSIEKANQYLGKPTFWEGEYRSPWFDAECKRRTTVRWIAQEIRGDYMGSGVGYFKDVDTATLEEGCMEPFFRGDLEFGRDFRTKEIVKSEVGRIDFWIYPDAADKMPAGRSYTIGVDISQGSGASQSVAKVGDDRTGEVVAEFKSRHVTPTEMAHVVMAMGYLFSGDHPTGAAEIIYEQNGPGQSFGKIIHQEGYPNIYHMEHVTNYGQPTKTPGWHTNPKSKQMLFEAFRSAMIDGSYIERSLPALKELDCYVHDPGGEILHVNSQDDDDPSGSKKNHGDMVIAGALMNYVMQATRATTEIEEPAIPVNCLAARMAEVQEAEDRQNDKYRWYDPHRELELGCRT